jgi:hypothetical protein
MSTRRADTTATHCRRLRPEGATSLPIGCSSWGQCQGAGWTLRQAASVGRHDAIAKWLLELGANVNPQGGYYGNALQMASVEGHDSVILLLHRSDVNVNSQGGRYGSRCRVLWLLQK